jgi:uncharacterized membrane protein affecting hemolysin expression
MNFKPMGPMLRSALTKRRWQATLLAVCASLLTALLLGISWYRSVEGARGARMAQFGNAAAAQLAALAIEPLITLDRIRLGVLATRMSELPELESVNIVTVDDRIVANAGPRPASDVAFFTHPVEFDGAVAGYVQVAIAKDAFAETGFATTYLLLPALIGALLAAAAGYLLGLRLDATADAEAALEDSGDAASDLPTARTDWLLTVNLFNLIALPGPERATVLTDVRRRTALVARQHDATISELPNTGILLSFRDAVPDPDPDQCFKVICAALLLAEMLDELNESRHAAARPELKFRFGVHIATRSSALPEQTNADAIHDTLVLSAVAPEGSIAASREAFERLPRPERFVVEDLANPILKTLTTSAHDRCVIVSAAADAYGAALDRQSELLRAQDDSISTPSTF